MKWITHQAGAALATAALGLPPAAIASSLAGAILPDVLDQKASRLAGASRKARQRAFNRLHRGTSHWFGWYAALIIAICAWPLPSPMDDCALGFAIGAISHVFLDMLTPQGIPLLPFSRKGKLAAPVCVTGHWSEYVFLALMLGGGIWHLASQGALGAWAIF